MKTKSLTKSPVASRGYMPPSKTDNHPTPQAFYAKLHKLYGFTCDAAASPENAKCKVYFTESDNGLTKDWGTHTVWLNPPYGRVIKSWAQKSLDAARKGATVVMLVPSRTDTKWFKAVAERPEVQLLFVCGRLKFGEAKNAAPFPNVALVIHPRRAGRPRMKVRFIDAA